LENDWKMREAEQRSQARRPMTHPGVGPVTALATDVFLGASFSAATYTYDDFKSQVVQGLQESFGQNDVEPDEKAVKIKASGNRRSSDVIVATSRIFPSRFRQ